MRKFFGLGSSSNPPPPPPPPPPSPAPKAEPKPAQPSLVGRWKEPKGADTTEFLADGTVMERPATGESIRGRYTLEGSKLKIRLQGMTDDLSFTAVVKGNTLEMTDPDGAKTSYERAV
ncbi:MAG: DUF5640 domain-containing protein [Chthoniobacterales bacterium]